MYQSQPLAKHYNVLPSKLLDLKGSTQIGSTDDKRLLIGYGSGLYPVVSHMGVQARKETNSARAASMIDDIRAPKKSQFDFIAALNDSSKPIRPFDIDLHYQKSNDKEMSKNSSEGDVRIKMGCTDLRSLSSDLRSWDGGSGMHWRLAKPHMLLVDDLTFNVANSQVDHWLNKMMVDIDANRYYCALATLFMNNQGNNFLYGTEKANQELSLKAFFHQMACASYDGDVRNMDAVSIETASAAKWFRHIDQHQMLWLASYLPLIMRHKEQLGLSFNGINDTTVDELVETSRLLEQRRLDNVEEQIVRRGRRTDVPTDEDLLFDHKNSIQLANDIMKQGAILKNMDIWMVDERLGMEQGTASLYEVLPFGLKKRVNSISSRTRLVRLYSPFSMTADKFQVLGGPLPMDPSMCRKGLRAMNRADSMKLACNSLVHTGLRNSIHYVMEKVSRNKLFK